MVDDDLPDAIPAEPRTRKRRLAIGAALVVMVGVAGAASIMLPAQAVDRAARRTFDCVYAIGDSGEGDPADCRQSGAMLTLARTLPWTRDEARQEQAEVEEVVLDHLLRVASVRDFDVGLRDRAGRALVELYRGEYPPQRGRSLAGGFVVLAGAGAHELMVELASPQDSTHARSHTMRAALLLGDWEAAGRIAQGSSGGGGNKFAIEAMIVACILGDRQTAAAHLAEVDAMGDSPWFSRLQVEQHCGLPHAGEPPEGAAKIALSRVASLYEPGAIIDRESHPNRHNELGMTVARLALSQTDPIEWGQDQHDFQIELIDRIGLDDPDGLTVVLMRTRNELPGAGGPVIVAELEAGARRLAELAATAPIELELQRSGRSLHPRRSLVWGGFCLASMAAAERVWRGQLDEAQAIYQVARELAANEAFRPLARLGELPLLGLHARLDLQEALRIARSISDEELAATDPFVQVILRLQLALVHEQADELDRAVEPSAVAFGLLPSLPNTSMAGLGFDPGARWVHGALLFRAGREASLELEAPAEPRGHAMDGAAVFAYWWTAARADPAAQVGYRWRSGGHSTLWLPVEPWALSSALELLARSGPVDKRDLWLDVVSSDIRGDPLGLIRARLSAAEGLGDAVAVKRWREREAALLERLRDDRAAALYRLL